jgi:hypothetical protein
MSLRIASLILAGAALLSGCATLSDQPNVGPCPVAAALYEADRIVVFQGSSTLDNVAYSAAITNVRSTCRYFGDEPIRQVVDIDLEAGLGPAGEPGEKELPIFVAVTRAGQVVLERETFNISVDLERRGRRIALTEEIDSITIPRAEETTSGTNFEIVVGFALSPQQLAFNRSRRSLEAPSR